MGVKSPSLNPETTMRGPSGVSTNCAAIFAGVVVVVVVGFAGSVLVCKLKVVN